MKVVCIGAGYVGCVTAAAFATAGHDTTLVDIDQSKVDQISRGECPLYEPQLEPLIRLTAARQTLKASTSYEAVKEADIVFICVGTPSQPDGSADLGFVRLAAQAVAQFCPQGSGKVIVNKSTVPVGTSDMVASIIEEAELRLNADFFMASNPEFLREGSAVRDVFFPERIVIGADSPHAFEQLKRLYQPLLERSYDDEAKQLLACYYPEAIPPAQYIETDRPSSELIKYSANAFLAVKISFINEIARLCDALGADVRDVAKGIGSDSRIGSKFLEVSSGWSGSCFPKDTAELLAVGRSYHSALPVVEAAVQSNQAMHDYCISKIKAKLKSLHGKKIAVLGVTFKPDTDDARVTQANILIRELLRLGADVRVHDPQGMPMFRKVNPDLSVRYFESPEAAAAGADALLLLTHWRQYLKLDWLKMGESMRRARVFDLRNFLTELNLPSYGWEYEGLGLRQP
ncbi:UDP-glucose dehydrogenase family protein [Paenibacillus senegalensis]|uniref:UDP-glucose dehydrogenase family protein n=1 Tax=Paenibacillus senegalensis TaxID=1465766 RepID=UPI000289165A|nr:nucleotide sugar dehydrogenase [Paenibacillus senegalensis]